MCFMSKFFTIYDNLKIRNPSTIKMEKRKRGRDRGREGRRNEEGKEGEEGKNS